MQFKNRISRDKSELLFNEAKNMFPGGVNSPVRAFKSVSGPPLFIKHGQGCRIIDEDNNEYIDFCNSWGPLILGHNNEKVKASIIEALDHGTSFGTPTAYGNKIGKLILENHKYLERIRFVCSGTEAVMSAIRLARGYTKKNKIVKFEGCYHGHVDSLMVKAGSGLITFGESTSAGIPQSFANETIVLKLNDYESLSHTLKEYGHDIAAVIIEPVPANNGLLLQDKEFLSFIIDECKKYDVLSIFDEVISGFRVSFGGAAEYYNLQPDLLTFGKIIGGGMPVGMYGGKAEIMKMIAPEGPVYQAGTLSANPVTLAAGIAALELLLSNDFYRNMENKTSYFVNKIETHITENGYDAGIINIGSIFWIKFSKERIISSDQINPSGMDRF
jgi:glutamate-1-semialdehyde 2,1-aminomutase